MACAININNHSSLDFTDLFVPNFLPLISKLQFCALQEMVIQLKRHSKWSYKLLEFHAVYNYQKENQKGCLAGYSNFYNVCNDV